MTRDDGSRVRIALIASLTVLSFLSIACGERPSEDERKVEWLDSGGGAKLRLNVPSSLYELRTPAGHELAINGTEVIVNGEVVWVGDDTLWDEDGRAFSFTENVEGLTAIWLDDEQVYP